MKSLARTFGNPWFHLVWIAYGAYWFFAEKANIGFDGWLALFTIAATFIIQSSQNTDTLALHVKLDALIHAASEASDDLMRAEEKTEAEIEQLRPC